METVKAKWSMAEFKKLATKKQKKQNKYNAVKSIWSGIWNGKCHNLKFDSLIEKHRFCELLLLEKRGIIRNLKRQKKFLLIEKSADEREAIFIIDFVYEQNGMPVAEDVKSLITSKIGAYVLKRKLFKKIYPQYVFREYFNSST